MNETISVSSSTSAFIKPSKFFFEPKEKRAEKLIEKVRNMINDLHEKTGLPNKLEISDEEIEKVAKTAINDGAIIVNPKKADFEDIVEILRKAR